jgi:hypothetical protein
VSQEEVKRKIFAYGSKRIITCKIQVSIGCQVPFLSCFLNAPYRRQSAGSFCRKHDVPFECTHIGPPSAYSFPPSVSSVFFLKHLLQGALWVGQFSIATNLISWSILHYHNQGGESTPSGIGLCITSSNNIVKRLNLAGFRGMAIYNSARQSDKKTVNYIELAKTDENTGLFVTCGICGGSWNRIKNISISGNRIVTKGGNSN